MSLRVKTAKSLLEQMNKHFGNKYMVNEEDIDLEPKEEEEEKEDEEQPMSEEDGEGEEEKKEEEPVTEEGSLNDMGELEKGVAGIVEKLISENFGSDMEAQKAAVEEMMKLAESEETLSNDFMEMLSDVTSAMKVEEDADGEAMVVFEPEKWKQLGEKYSK